MVRRAIVVHGDDATSRLISSSLRVFRPGYQVATAQTLSRATDWFDGEPHDLIVVELNGHDPVEITQWAKQNDVDIGDIVLVGADDASLADLGFGGDLPSRFDLSTLLAVVRRLNRARRPGL